MVVAARTATSQSHSQVGLAPRHWTTPRRLQAFLIGIWALTLVVAVAGVASIQTWQDALRLAGPAGTASADAAQGVDAGLAGMDAQLAAELVARPGQNVDATNGFAAQRDEVTSQLASASQGDLDATRQQAVTGLGTAFAQYVEWATRARELHDHGDPASLVAARHASQVIQTQLRPAADQLVADSSQVVEVTGPQREEAANVLGAIALVTGLLLLALLVWVQVFVTWRMHRVLNVPMLLATVLVAALFLHLVDSFVTTAQLVNAARDQAYLSISELNQTRASIFRARGDENRWLYDRVRASDWEAAFATDSQDVFIGAAGESGVNTWNTFLSVDQQIRQDELQGNHDAAVLLDIGTDPNEGTWAFDQVVQAVQQAMDVKRGQYVDALNAAADALTGLDLQVVGVAIVTALLAWWGLQIRIREYSR